MTDVEKEKRKARSKAWREANKEKVKAWKKAYYEANKDNPEYKEKVKAYEKTSNGKFARIRAGAKRRGIPFDLTLEQHELFHGQPCAYCDEQSTGLDRVDNDGGYEIGNVVPSCGNCNSKKRAKPLETFLNEIGMPLEVFENKRPGLIK